MEEKIKQIIIALCFDKKRFAFGRYPVCIKAKSIDFYCVIDSQKTFTKAINRLENMLGYKFNPDINFEGILF